MNFLKSYAKVLFAGMTCLVLAILCIKLAQYNAYASIWAVNAVLLIFIFRSNPELRWQLYFTGIGANWIANLYAGAPALLALAISFSNSMEILIPMLFVPMQSGTPFFSRGLDRQTNMLALCVTAGCLLAATFTTLLVIHTWTNDSFFTLSFNWFTIDLLAMIAILPPGLASTKERLHKLFQPVNFINWLLVACSAVLLTWLTTQYPDIRFVVILMPLLYAAFRLGVLGTSMISFLIVSFYITTIVLGTLVNTQFQNTAEWISYSFLLMCITLLPPLVIAMLIEQRDDMESELKHLATHDPLTILINRREIELKIKSLIKVSKKAKKIHSLFFIDLDNFKVVNDTAGHASGDEFLRRIAEILTQCVRKTDIVARLGGDEFAVLLPDCSMEHAVHIARKMIERIKKYVFVWDDNAYSTSASLGLVTFKSDEVTLETILSQADIACYTAKNMGGDRVSIFQGTNSDASRYLTEIKLAAKLHKALQEHAFVLHTQQIIPLQHDPNLRPYHEILIRMQDENGALILPGVFMKIAERQNLTVEIDKWVINQVLIVNADKMIAAGQPELSINLSAAAIHSTEFHQLLEQALAASPLDKQKIGFELKEAAFLGDIETAKKLLTLLEKHGCFICLDNFGQGLHSYQHFKHFSDIHIKIDGSYVQDINSNPVSYAIVDSINQLGHKLGAKTIVTLVESDHVLQSARKIGIDYAQGYAVSAIKPLKDLL